MQAGMSVVRMNFSHGSYEVSLSNDDDDDDDDDVDDNIDSDYDHNNLEAHCSVLFLSRPRSEGWPHHGRTFSIYLCPLSF